MHLTRVSLHKAFPAPLRGRCLKPFSHVPKKLVDPEPYAQTLHPKSQTMWPCTLANAKPCTLAVLGVRVSGLKGLKFRA